VILLISDSFVDGITDVYHHAWPARTVLNPISHTRKLKFKETIKVIELACRRARIRI
jgi:hypothetical protein